MNRAVCAALLVAVLPFSAVNIASAQKSEQAAPDKVAKVSLKIGDTAPDFTLLSDQWKTVKLSDFRGKKNVLLAVYVLAFTGG
jgi:peroxiredoxin